MSKNPLIIVLVTLLVFGLLMIYNATLISSQEIYGDPYRFALLHVLWIVLGLLMFFIAIKLDYHTWYKFAKPIFITTLLVLGFLALFGVLPCDINIPFAPCLNGANRWLYLNPTPLPKIPLLGVVGFQPSELAKIALIMYLSYAITKSVKESSKNIFGIYLIVTGLFSSLIVLQPNMSTAALMFLIGTCIYIASGQNLKPFMYVAPFLILVGVVLVLSSPYRRERLMTLWNPESKIEEDSGYHAKQVLIALGSGGVAGVGLGQSRQKFSYLPEITSDSIFAIIGEELGFIGTISIVVLFSFLIYKGLTVAKESNDLFGRLLAVGITCWFGLQFIINASAMTKLIPLTGVPIPFISYGGSATVFSLFAYGILVRISQDV